MEDTTKATMGDKTEATLEDTTEAAMKDTTKATMEDTTEAMTKAVLDSSIIVSDVVPVEVTNFSLKTDVVTIIFKLAPLQILPEATMIATTEAATESTMEAATEAVMDSSTFSDMPVEVIILNIGCKNQKIKNLYLDRYQQLYHLLV